MIQRWWDRRGQRGQGMVVLVGSAFSFLQGLVGARGPLHGRRTGQLDLRPFDYRDAALFYPHLDPSDRVRAFACLGGMPAYLRFFRAGEPLALHLRRTVLAPDHFLFREGEELLRTEFHRETLYASILRAVAQGQVRPSDIARAVGRPSADQIFDHLIRLQDLGLLEREVPVTERERARHQRVQYRLAEPYLRFWYRFVSPHRSLLQLGRAEPFWKEVAPNLDDFVARTAWEEVVRQAVWRRQDLRMSGLGRWWDSSTEIDLVGVWGDRVTLVGECKWTASPLSNRDLARLRAKARAAFPGCSPTCLLASRSGFRADLAGREDLLLLDPAALY
ncbi:MAG: ATP-binding protein [Candidatus Eremiobacterota bacterium]